MAAIKRGRQKAPDKSKAEGAGAKLIRFALTPVDFKAMAFIRARHGQPTNSAAARFALFQQYLRDKAYGVDATGPRDAEAAERAKARLVSRPPAGYVAKARAIREAVTADHRRAAEIGHDGAFRQWAMWVYPEHAMHLKGIEDAWALYVRAEVIRLAIRVQATLDGFAPAGGVWP